MSSTPAHTFVPSDEIRARFSSAMSEMYRDEVPQYGTLIELVADINQRTLQAEPALLARMQRSGELARLGVERHGAIRVGTAAELSMLDRKSTRLNSSHLVISYAVFCLKKKQQPDALGNRYHRTAAAPCRHLL